MLAIYTCTASLRQLIEAQVPASASSDRESNACFIVSGPGLAISRLITLVVESSAAQRGDFEGMKRRSLLVYSACSTENRKHFPE
jgi:hypothetical protein